MRKKHIFIGFGDLAQRCCKALQANPRSARHTIVGVARGRRSFSGLEFWQGDVKSPDMLARIGEHDFDTAVITLSPSGSGEHAYREAYLKPVQALCELWHQHHPPARIIYVSSSGVYGQQNGEWVDHESPTQPTRDTAKILCQSEQHILGFSQGVVLRFSGIYGTGRDYLLRQVMAGKGGNSSYTNRIHVEDCCRAILHLMQLPPEKLAPVYLASDKAPVPSKEIRLWLAEQLGVDKASLSFDEDSGRAGNKRCDSRLLVDSGFAFKYPTYKEGYLSAIDVFKREHKLE